MVPSRTARTDGSVLSAQSRPPLSARSAASGPWTSAVSFLYPVVDEDYQNAVAAFPGARAEGFVRATATLANATASIDVSVLGLKSAGALQVLNIVSGRMPRAAMNA